MNYLLKRLLWMIPTLIGIVTITFFLTRLRPDPVSLQMMGEDGLKDNSASAQYREELRAYYGLDKPLLEQYFILWKNVLTFDFGNSRIDHRPVWDKITSALPVTLLLNVITIFVVYVISIPLGVYSALHEKDRTDKFITAVLYMLYSLPVFWVGMLLIKYFAGGDYLNLFPLGGLMSDGAARLSFLTQVQDVLWHLFLPVVASVYGAFAFLSRFVKSSFMEALRSDYVRTAKAKGLSSRRVIYVHAMRNSLIPIVTLMAGILPELFSGSVIIESIFSIPGMGNLIYDSIRANDDTVIIAVTLFSALLTLSGIMLADILYALIDPRIQYGKKEGDL